MATRERAYRALGEILLDARNETGLTQRQLAERLKRTHSVIAKIELGERRIDIIEFIELARALRMDPRELFARIVK